MRQRDIIDVHQPSRPFFDAFARQIHDDMFGAIARNNGASSAQLYHYRQLQSDVLDKLHDMLPHTPDRIWRQAFYKSMANPEKSRAWKARALNLNPEPAHNAIALSGMAPIHDGERWLLGIAYPSPPPLGPMVDKITDIILIDPKTGIASIHGDDNPSLVLPLTTDRFTVHADAKAWARELAVQRLEWFGSLENARRQANVRPEWTGYAASALLIGDPRKVIWPKATSITAGEGVDAKTLKSALFRQSRIPHVEEQILFGKAA